MVQRTEACDCSPCGRVRFFPSTGSDTQVWPLAQNEAANILLLNFCQKGRCEVALEDGQFAFLSQGHMAVGTQQAQEEYRYPSGLYEGIELFLDLDMLAHRPYPLFQEGGKPGGDHGAPAYLPPTVFGTHACLCADIAG
ncbi:MAG: hypothetical protein ACLVD8_26010 [Enterocloster sp.]|uniref:hypothetical protein n=1 Tax=Enterocloster sp. TaxID=2719315 RepID=UPI00399C4482